MPLFGIPVAIGDINRSSPSGPVSIPHLIQGDLGISDRCLVAEFADDLVAGGVAVQGHEAAASSLIPSFALCLVFEAGQISITLELLAYLLLSDRFWNT